MLPEPTNEDDLRWRIVVLTALEYLMSGKRDRIQEEQIRLCLHAGVRRFRELLDLDQEERK